MSTIYQPPGQPFNPLFQDCLDNAISRQSPNVTTSGTGLVTLFSCLIPANSFQTDGKKAEWLFLGNLNGAAGTKRVVVFIDTIGTFLIDTGALAINNQNYSLQLHFGRLLTTNLHSWGHYFTYPFGSVTVITSLGQIQQLNSFDWTIDHTLILQGQCSNGADNVSLILESGGVR
jgi:hypothetical protein